MLSRAGLGLVLLLFACLLPSFCGSVTMQDAVNSDSEQAGEQAEKKLEQNIANLVFYLDELAREQIEVQARLNRFQSPESIRKTLSALTEEFEKLSWEVMMMQTDPDPNYSRLSEIQTLLNHQRNSLADLEKPLLNAIRELDGYDRQWTKRKKRLNGWVDRVGMNPSFSAMEQAVDNGRQNIDNLLQQIRTSWARRSARWAASWRSCWPAPKTTPWSSANRGR